MLVLSRKRGESIIIGDDIAVVVIEARGGRVRLGVQAPSSVPVHRSEIRNAIDGRPEPPPVGVPGGAG
jgi:carbon storage regulator